VKLRGPALFGGAHCLQQPFRERRHVVGTVAQRRKIDPRHGEPPVQVAAEAVLPDIGFNRGQRAGHEANLGRRRRCIDPHFAVARNAEEPRLNRRGQPATS